MSVKRNGGLVFICIMLLSLANGENSRDKVQENCTYVITLETTCTKGAETSNPVSLRFGDTNSNDILIKDLNNMHIRKVDSLDPEVLDDIPRKPFQTCMVDKFYVKGRCVVSPICYLYLRLAGNDDWRPGFAQVKVLENNIGDHQYRFSSDFFYFRRYVPRKVWHGMNFCDRDVIPFGIGHKRKVFGGKQ